MTGATRDVQFLGISPYLFYDDLAAALDWLERVLGFREDVRFVDDTGTVAEAEMLAGSSRIMMGGRGPEPGEGSGQLLIVYVDDVDAHHERVVHAGVDADFPVDMPYGPRVYTVTDPWGYKWNFWQMVKDQVELEEGWREIRS